MSALSKRSDGTAKEGNINDNVSDVPVEAHTAPTTGRGWYSLVLAAPDVSSIFFFVRCARALMAALQALPPHVIEGRRRDVRSLGRGMGVLGW